MNSALLCEPPSSWRDDYPKQNPILTVVPPVALERTSIVTELRVKPRLTHSIVTFELLAPDARVVQLAAEFTDWQKWPLYMRRSVDGVWKIKVPLQPGRYAYRFLVDGEWRDDPHCAQWEPNAFGTANAVVQVGPAIAPSNGCHRADVNIFVRSGQPVASNFTVEEDS